MEGEVTFPVGLQGIFVSVLLEFYVLVPLCLRHCDYVLSLFDQILPTWCSMPTVCLSVLSLALVATDCCLHGLPGLISW